MPEQTEHRLPNVALVGIGGYGRTHSNFYLKLMDEGKMRFTGTVVLPHLMEAYAEQVAELNARHIPIYPSDDALLEAQRGTLDLVGLPVGIAAHRPMTCKFLEAGVNVFRRINLPAKLETDETDFALLLSNLLERAIVESFQCGSRELSIILQHVDKQCILEISVRGAAQIEFNDLLTTFAKKYSARADFSTADGNTNLLMYWRDDGR